MAVDIDDKKLDGKGLSDLWGIIKQYVAQHGSGVVPATEDTLGGIMVGSTLSITNAGVLNLPTLVTASTFRSVSVDAYGRVVGGTNPTTLAGYGITDAKIENGVITLGGNTITPITSLSGYATQSWVQQQGYTTNIGTVTQVKIGSTAYNPTSGVVSLPAYPTVPTKVSELTNDSGYTTNIGTVTQVKVGSTAYNPSSGVVSLPAYPTSLPASDVYSWAKASSKPSYTLDEVGDGSSRKLANYLPLSGGTVTGTIIGNTGYGLVVRSNNTGRWCEGIRVYPASNNYCLLSLMSDTSSGNAFAMVHQTSTHVAYFEFAIDDVSKFIYMPYDGGTLALTKNIPTSLSQLTNDSGFITSSALSSYLPLSGGTLTGVLKINSAPSTSNPPLQICYTADYTATEQTIGLLKFGAPSYDTYLGLAPASVTYFGKVGYFCHISSEYEFDWMTSNWTKLMALECSTGNLWVKGSFTAGTGGTITGNAGDGNPPLKINSTYTGVWNYSFGAMMSLSSGTRNVWAIGDSYSSKNCGLITYVHSSYGSTSNCMSFGMYGVNDVLTISGNSNVGINTTSPSYKLTVSGGLYASTYYNLPFSVQRGTMNHIKTSSNTHIYYLPMSGSDARKCIFSYIMEYYYQYSSGNYSYHAGNGFADTMGVKYVYSITYDGQTVTNCWVVTTGGHDAGNMYYSYIIIN